MVQTGEQILTERWGDILLDGHSATEVLVINLLLDGTDSSGTDGGDNVDLEDGSSSYAVLSLPTDQNFLVEQMIMQ